MVDPFTHAVASFDPTESAVLLWARVVGPSAVSWVVATDPALSDVVASGEASATADRDHTVTVDVTGLAPATTYFYRFEADGLRSPVGRTRTLPAAPVERFRLGLVSCARYSVAPLGVYRALAEREVDLVLHLGDYVYEDDGSKGVREHEPPHEAVTLDDYRRRIGQVRRDPDCQALHLRHPMIAIVDDHDVADNCWATGAKNHDDAQHGPFAARALAATTARQEWLPQRLRDPDDPRRTWRSVAVGDLAELVLLDTRLSGRDRQAGDEGAKPLHDPTRSLLGDEQRGWLAERLADVGRPWAVVASGVVVNPVCLPLPAGMRANQLLPNGYAVLDGEVMHDDQWDGYPAERARLTGWLGDRGRRGGRSVLLSADIHSSWVFRGPHDDEGHPVSIEMTVPSVASKPMGRGRVPGLWRVLDASVRRLEHVPWADVTRRGYGILELSPDQAAMEWRFVEPTMDDPAADSWLGAAYATARTPWPPALETWEPGDDPERPSLTDPLPGRPDDLPKLRRSHLLRVAAARGAGGLALAGAVGALVRSARR